MNIVTILIVSGIVITATWTIIQIVRETRSLKIEGGVGLALNNPDVHVLIIKATNIGKRPIQVESFHVYPDKKSYKTRKVSGTKIFIPQGWPKRLVPLGRSIGCFSVQS